MDATTGTMMVKPKHLATLRLLEFHTFLSLMFRAVDMASQGTAVLLGDPGRAFLPSDGLRQLASFDLPPPHVRDSSNGLHTGQVWEVAGVV